MESDPELWKELQLGDRVRVVHMPNFSGPQPLETLALYEWLFWTGHVMRVELEHRDGDAYPWSDGIVVRQGELPTDDPSREPSADGPIYHRLMLNHDGLERAD